MLKRFPVTEHNYLHTDCFSPLNSNFFGLGFAVLDESFATRGSRGWDVTWVTAEVDLGL